MKKTIFTLFLIGGFASLAVASEAAKETAIETHSEYQSHPGACESYELASGCETQNPADIDHARCVCPD